MASLLSWVGNAASNVEQAATHNAVTNFVGHDVVQPVAHVAAAAPSFAYNNLAKPIAQTAVQAPIDAANTIYNRAVAPTLNLPHLTPIQTTPISGLSHAVNATGSLHQTLASNAQLALMLASGGVAGGLEKGASAVAPRLAGTLAPRVLSNAALGSGFNAASAAAQGAKPGQILKSAAIGAGVGGALPVAGEGLKFGVKGATKVANSRVPLNDVGAVGKDVNNRALPPPTKSPAETTTPVVGKNKAAIPQQGSERLANTGGNMATNFDKLKLTPQGNVPFSKADQKFLEQPASARYTNLPPTSKGTPAELNTKTSNVLSKMPSPTRELPPASKVNGGLPLASSPSALKQTFASKVTAIRNLGTASSTKLADTIQQTERTRQALQAKYNYAMPTAQKLSKDDFSNMVDVIEGKAKPNSATVAQAAKEASGALKQVNKDAFAQGTLIGSRQNYFPHVYDFKAIQKNPGMYDAALQHLIDTGAAKNPEDAVQLFKQHATQNDLWPNTQGNLENTRETDMPGYAKTKGALNGYIGGASTRIAQATHLGTENEVARRLIGNIRLEGGNADTATKAVENYLRAPDTGQGALSKISSGARSVFGAASLSKAPISHLGQTSNTAVEAGIGRTLTGWARHLSQNPADKDFVAKTGVTNPQELHSYQNQFTSVKGAASRITAAGLKPVMKVNRSVTALAGRAYGQHLASTGDVTGLRALGVEGDIGKTLTSDQEVQAARGLVNKTQFSGSRATTPIAAETAGGKLVGQFRTAYAYKQTGFLYNQVLKEAQKGNLVPLARFIGVSAPVGAGTVLAKNAISGKKESGGGIATDALGALGGIPGEAAVQLAKYGLKSGDLTNTLAGLAVPLAGEGLTVGSNLDSLLHGKPAPAERTVLKAIPLVGSRVSSALLPPKTGPNAPAAPASALPQNSAAAKTASATQLKAFKANAGTGYGLNQLPDGRYEYNINGNVSTTTSLATARQAIAKASLQDSGTNFKAIGNTVYSKDAAGKITATPKTTYDYNLGAANLVTQKDAGNVAGWMTAAQNQLSLITKQLQDPTINSDPLQVAKLQNDAATIQNDIAKYQSYGGFTKGSSGSSTKAKIPNFKIAASKLKAPKVGKISAPKGSTFKAPKLAKGSSGKVSKIAVKSSKQKAPKLPVAAIPKVPKSVA